MPELSAAMGPRARSLKLSRFAGKIKRGPRPLDRDIEVSCFCGTVSSIRDILFECDSTYLQRHGAISGANYQDMLCWRRLRGMLLV